MAVYEFEGKVPRISKEATFIHPEAVIIGDVEIMDHCYIGAGAVLRGDIGPIVIGSGSNIQDRSVLHCEPETSIVLGEECHIAHGAILHGPLRLGKRVMIGMNAVVLQGCDIGDESIIGAGGVVRSGSQIPARKLLMGIPAKIVRDVDDNAATITGLAVKVYQDLAARSLTGMNRVE